MHSVFLNGPGTKLTHEHSVHGCIADEISVAALEIAGIGADAVN